MKQAILIAKLNKLFPEVNAVPRSDFDGSEDGIWFRGSEDYLANGERVFDTYNVSWNFGMNPVIEKVLEAAGWYSESYDAGTCMAYSAG
jgi:hypothetical protein